MAKKGEPQPREVKMIRKNREIVGKLHEGRGFTLIELVVVMGVIGTLMAIVVPTYLEYTTKTNDLSALSDTQNMLKLANQVLLDGGQIFYLHNPVNGRVIGDRNDLLGNYIPEIYTLSPRVNAQVQIINGFGGMSIIWLWISHERGTDDPFGLNGKKTFNVWMNGLTGQVWKNY